MKSSQAIAVLLVLIAMVSIQSGASLAKHLFPIVGAQGTTALRLTVAALLLMALWRPWRTKLSRNEKAGVIFYGCALGAMNFLFYLALERIPLGIAVAIEFTGPLGVAIFASRRAMDFLWALLAIVGILLILPLTNLSAPLDPVGIIFALAAGGCWALYIIFGQRAVGKTHAGIVTSLGMAAGALLVIPLGLAHAGTKLFDLSLAPMALGIGLLSSAIPYSLEMVALKRMPAKNFGILMSIEPAIGALSGYLLLGEWLTLLQWTAIACVIAASLGSSLTQERSQKG